MCNLYFADHQEMSDLQKVSFLTQRLTGRALDWASAVWTSCEGQFPNYIQFRTHFQAAFNYPDHGKSSSARLLQLKQGSDSVAEYAVKFRILAAESGCNETTLTAVYCKGLHSELQLELACREAGLALDQQIQMNFRLDQHIKSRSGPSGGKTVRARLVHTPQEPAHRGLTEKPMEIGSYHLSRQKWGRRVANSLCLYCGGKEHVITQGLLRRGPGKMATLLVLTLNPDHLTQFNWSTCWQRSLWKPMRKIWCSTF